MSESGFSAEKEEHGGVDIFIFTFEYTFTDMQFIEFLALLDKLLSLKKPFLMLIDTSNCKHIPIKASMILIKWMKKRKEQVRGVLLGSSVVINSDTIKNLINAAFKIQKPTSPNSIFTNKERAMNFLTNLIQNV